MTKRRKACTLRGVSGSSWPGEQCAKCGRRIVVGYSVSDAEWMAVVGDNGCWCLACFDEEAERLGVDYAPPVLYQVSWADWVRHFQLQGVQ